MYHNVHVFLIALILITPLCSVNAQEASSINYRLTWSKSQNTARYEIIVKKENPAAREYEEFARGQARDLWFDVTLTPGRYCFQVIPFTDANVVGIPSEWEYFDVVMGKGKQGGSNVVRSEKALSVDFSLAWAPLVSLPYEKSPFNTRYTDNPLLPIGGGLDISLIFLKIGTGYWGVDFYPSWNYLRADLGNNLETALTMPAFSTHLLYQYRFNAKQRLNLRLGAGMFLFIDAENRRNEANLIVSSTAAFSTNLGIAGGAAFEQILVKDFFIKAGVDYVYFIISRGRRAHFLAPTLSIGQRF